MWNGEYFINIDDHFFQQPLLVWSTNFFSRKKTIFFSDKVHMDRGGGGGGVS